MCGDGRALAVSAWRRAAPPPPPKIARSAACERPAIAELRATGSLLHGLQSGRQRQAFEAGYGLCMKHHAQACLLSPRGEVRAFLAADPSRRLSELMRWLKDERPIRGQNEPVRAAAEVSTLALRRFCGFG